MLCHAEGRSKTEIAKLAEVSRPTVDKCLSRYATAGAAGLLRR